MPGALLVDVLYSTHVRYRTSLRAKSQCIVTHLEVIVMYSGTESGTCTSHSDALYGARQVLIHAAGSTGHTAPQVSNESLRPAWLFGTVHDCSLIAIFIVHHRIQDSLLCTHYSLPITHYLPLVSTQPYYSTQSSGPGFSFFALHQATINHTSLSGHIFFSASPPQIPSYLSISARID